MSLVIDSAVELVSGQLGAFAKLDDFWGLFDVAFGKDYNQVAALRLRSQWQSGDFGSFPSVEVIDGAVLGNANGAYASSTNKIYLSDAYVKSATTEALIGTLLEEYGHFVDAQVNLVDSAGDEGAIFAALVQGYSLDAKTLQELKAEDDSAIITVNGEAIRIEQSTNILQTPTGDGSLVVTVDEFGRFGTDTVGGQGGVYDPLGSKTAASTTFRSYVALGIITSGTTGPRTELKPSASPDEAFTNFTDTATNSTFTVAGLQFQLKQLVQDTLDTSLARTGSRLDQIYTITNTTTQAINFDLVRYVDGDLDFDGSLIDGGGRILQNGQEVLFETDSGGTGETDTSFFGISGTGGSIPTTNRWELDFFSSLNSNILGGNALRNTIVIGDSDADQFIDTGSEYDVALALRNVFSLASGQSITYTSTTRFGSGQAGQLDITPPIGGVSNLPATTLGNNINVSWGATDPSGVRNYDVFVSINGAVFTQWQTNVTTTSAVYIGEVGKTYTFYSLATDNAGNKQLASTANRVSTQLINPITLAVSPASVFEDGTPNLVYTFTRTGSTTTALTVNYSIAGTANNSDYTGATTGIGKTITFVAGSSTATLTIDPTADAIGEFNETVELTLASGTGYTIGTTTAVTGTITNDDTRFSTPFDLLLLQDLSGSFGDDIATVRALVPNLIAGVNSLQPNTPIGISSFIDKPITPFGDSSDYVYKTNQALTTNASTIQTIFNGLTIGSGEDTPEAQLEALLQVAVRPTEIGFRSGTKRVVVLFTDADYHVAGDGAAAGITVPNNLDAILNGTPAGTGEDYPGVASLKQRLIAANILPVFAVTSGQVSTYQSLLTQLGVGGAVVQLNSDSSNIISAISQGLSNLFAVNINGGTTGLVTTEAGGTASFTVSLSTQPSANVTLGLQVSDTTEGTLSTSSLVFTPANWNVAQTVTVTGKDDPEGASFQDGDQTYQIVTSVLVSSDVNYNGINPVDLTVTNTDGDLPTVTLSVSPASVFENGTPNLVYTFTRTGATTNALNVNYSIAGTANNTDYTGATPGTGKTITFAAGSSTATVTIDPTADTTIEANETVALTLATGTGYTIGTTTAVTGTITNDDEALPTVTLAVSPASVLENGTPNLVYTFTRTGATTNALNVNYGITGTAGATDYTGATPGTGKTITFAAGSATATLTIDPTADTIFESNETVALTLATGAGYIIGTTTAVTGTITNDDLLPTINLSASQTLIEGFTSPQNVTYTVTLSNASSQAITVQYTTANGSATAGADYTSMSGTLTFNAGITSQVINIPILNDFINEPNETFTLALSSPTNATLGATTTTTTTLTDTLSTSVTTTLPANVENLTLTGTAAINGTGNAGPNVITGNSANNNLNGLNGNDTYVFVANSLLGTDTIALLGTDTIAETTTGGIDTIDFSGTTIAANLNLGIATSQTVNSNLKLILSANNVFENITGGNGSDRLTGNSLNNTLNGGSGNDQLQGLGGDDILWGGLGDDILTGGAGNDQYLFQMSGVFTNTLGVDYISQFDIGQDKINLSKATFNAITNLAGQPLTDFASVTDDELVDASTAHIVFSQSTGSVFYNQNGNVLSASSVFEFARLGNPDILLSSSDFVLG